MKFDKYEVDILRAVQHNGNITNSELAERVGLSPTPCWRRLSDLNKNGVIQQHVALLDGPSVGVNNIIFAYVSVNQRNEKDKRDFENAVQDREEVLECYASMGDADYLLKIAVADVSAYDKFVSDFLFKLKVVDQVKSHLMLRQVKRSTALPLGHLNQDSSVKRK